MIVTLTLNPSIDHHLFFDAPLRSEDTNRARTSLLVAGGKGLNVAKAVRSLGEPVRTLALTAGDTGRQWLELAAEGGLLPEVVCLARGRTRINPFIYVEGREVFRVSEKGPEAGGACLKALSSRVLSGRPRPAWAVLSGGLPEGLSGDAYARIVRDLSRLGVACAVDADGEALRRSLSARPDVIKPNIHELERLDGRRLRTRASRLAAARRALKSGARAVLASMADEGALWVGPEGAYLARSPRVRVTNTSGAGDATLGGYVSARHRGWPADLALTLAVACGAAAVSGEGRSGALDPRRVARLFRGVRVRPVSG
ncbi:MAG: Tagatose-6-phosphate kinase [Candidatus Omnitrophica bacterium]|nr:Tagatose-6-phosphate kinase [Candidatus Omnitrophota bacterium]